MAKFLALVAALFIFAPISIRADEIPAAKRALDFVCSVRQLRCDGLMAPDIKFYIGAPGSLGGYSLATPGTVYLNVELVDHPIWFAATLAHEVSHYVDHQLSLNPSVCDSEGDAWRIFNAWMLYVGHPEHQHYNWLKDYPGCSAKNLR